MTAKFNCHIIILSLLIIGCNSNPKTEEKNLGVKDTKQIASAENNVRKEIIGLWKLYKKSYDNKYPPSIQTDNEFLEIKDDNTFEESRKQGKWILSFTFSSDATSQTNTIFTKVLTYANDWEDIRSYYLRKTVENGTTFLILKSLATEGEEIYITQK